MNMVRENEKKSCALLKEEKGKLVEWGIDKKGGYLHVEGGWGVRILKMDQWTGPSHPVLDLFRLRVMWVGFQQISRLKINPPCIFLNRHVSRSALPPLHVT